MVKCKSGEMEVDGVCVQSIFCDEVKEFEPGGHFTGVLDAIAYLNEQGYSEIIAMDKDIPGIARKPHTSKIAIIKTEGNKAQVCLVSV